MDPRRVGDFAELIVREYLRTHGCSGALEAFNEERGASGTEPPSAESWYDVSQRLDLPNLIRRNNLPGMGRVRRTVELAGRIGIRIAACA